MGVQVFIALSFSLFCVSNNFHNQKVKKERQPSTQVLNRFQPHLLLTAPFPWRWLSVDLSDLALRSPWLNSHGHFHTYLTEQTDLCQKYPHILTLNSFKARSRFPPSLRPTPLTSIKSLRHLQPGLCAHRAGLLEGTPRLSFTTFLTFRKGYTKSIPGKQSV